MDKKTVEQGPQPAEIVHREGARGDDVARIKQHLIRLGYHPARDGAELVSAGLDLYV